MARNEFDRYWKEGEETVLKNPYSYGWKREGKIVASATADPITFCYAIHEAMLTNLGRMPTPEGWRALIGKLYTENYHCMGTAFKEGADTFLSDVYSLFNGRVYIVTNASPDNVKKKMVTLPSDHSNIPMVGGAKKYVVDENWEDIPATMNVPGLDRTVYLRRRMYGEILDRIMKEQGTTAPHVAVVGDIWELDLALPQYLGMWIVYTPGQKAPQFEKDIVTHYPRGFLADNLETVYTTLRKFVKQ